MSTTAMFRSRILFDRGRVLMVVTAALVLLGMAPLAGALEIHHALAAADHDGHQHSDSDLCQWVQHHTGHSLTICAPSAVLLRRAEDLNAREPLPLLSARPISGGPSRAPPLF